MVAKSSNKTVWIVASVVIVAAVFLFGNFNKFTGQQIKKFSNEISAHSCNADDRCEVNRLTADSADIGGDDDDTARLTLRGFESQISFLSGPFWNIVADKYSTLRIYQSNHYYDPSLLIDMQQQITVKDLTVEGLGGYTSAYVCVNSSGKLYRSQTPCA